MQQIPAIDDEQLLHNVVGHELQYKRRVLVARKIWWNECVRHGLRRVNGKKNRADIVPMAHSCEEVTVAVDVLNNCCASGLPVHKVAWAPPAQFVVICPRNPEHVMCAEHVRAGPVACKHCPVAAPPVDRTSCHYGYMSFVHYVAESQPRWPWPEPKNP